LLICVALGLTESRTATLAFAAGMAFIPFLWIRQRMRSRSPGLAWLVGILCAGLMAVVCALGLNAVGSLPQMMQLASASAAAPAEAAYGQGASAEAQVDSSSPLATDAAGTADIIAAPTAPPVVAQPQRGLLEGVTTLNSRTEIWSAALRTIASNPSMLLRGVTMERVMLTVAPQVPEEHPFVHLHNSYLEALLGMGLPGFGLLLAMLWVFGRASLRLMLDVGETTDLGTRFLPAVLVASLIIGMMEPFYFSGQYFMDRLFFIVAGLVVALAGRLKRAA
jgi:O-antigen ligase